MSATISAPGSAGMPPGSERTNAATTPTDRSGPGAPPVRAVTHEPAADDHSLGDDLIATLSLLGFSLAVAAGFARVFSGWDFFNDLAIVAIVGHGLSLLLRRIRVPLLLAFPLLVAVVGWTIGALFYRQTYSLGLPTMDTWELFRAELDLVSEQFRTAVAPVLFASGWDALAAIGIGAVVVLSDTFAFRAFARAEALVPGGVLFVFVAALGTDRNRVALTVLLVATGVATTAVLRAHHAPRRSAAIGPRRRSIAWAVPAAVVTAAFVAVAAGAIGPRLPGAESEALYETKGGNGGSTTNLTNPFVDIRSRLTNQGTSEIFAVRSDTSTYWRSVTLADFDGTIWTPAGGSDDRRLDTDGDFQSAPPGSSEFRQTIEIAALEGVYVPVAAEPVSSSSGDLGFDATTASVIRRDDGLVPGDRFEVVSAIPTYTADQLRSATSAAPPDPIYLQLPEDFPDGVVEQAIEETANAPTSYDKAIALQQWMRNEFTYSTEVLPGHSNNAIEAFLRDKVGYCEQFAGTYAAMLRSIGIPTRVSVGHTDGFDDGTGRFAVQGRNAHAWPEVWFDGLGWLMFEPTPGRGSASTQSYNPTVEAGQEDGPVDAGSGDGGTQEIPGPEVTAPVPTLPGGEAVPTTFPDISPNFPDQLDSVDGGGGTGEAADGGSSPWPLALLGIIVLLVLIAPALVRSVRRRTHRDPDVEIQRLWARATRAVASVGVDVRSTRTPSETAEITSEQFPTASRPMKSLASALDHAVYSADGGNYLASDGTYGTTIIVNCSVWCRQIEKAVADSISPIERFKQYFTRWE